MPVNVPLKLTLPNGMETGVIIGDTHYPFEDKRTMKLINRFLVETQPDFLIYNGDLSDFYQLSVFAKDPARIPDLQKDINKVRGMFEYHKLMLPHTKRILIQGTHEYRFQKFLWSRAAELAGLDCMTVHELYGLDDYGIQDIPFEQGLLINDIFLVLHGDIASVHSGYTAKRQYEKNGGCGMCNHTHRGGSFYKTDRFGTWGWWENFCLCSLDPDWIKNPNWQQGFSLVHFTGHKRFWVEQVPIIGHKFLYRGELYE